MYTAAIGENLDVSVVGGKGANLGRLVRAGFRVPGGFVVTTDACRAGMTADIRAAIATAYRALDGNVSVAVRSSATAEDMAGASMAGQYETYLDIRGEEAVLAAVEKCWASLRAARATAYLAEQGVDAGAVAMAVVVQQLVPADVAGVLFTVNPNGSAASAQQEMVVEASWGLGESVVSGRVQPDVLVLSKAAGRVISERIGDKREELRAGTTGEQAVSTERRKVLCLTPDQLPALWQIGRRAEDFFAAPQDLEWAYAGNVLYVLQSRPITTVGRDADEDVLTTERDRLRTALQHGRGPWVLHNVAETLDHPTPLTWSIVGRFMSGAGGYGALYREAGFEPSENACREGFLELIAGRVYMDLSRAPEMFGHDFGFGYDLDALKAGGDISAAAPTLPRGGLRARLRAGRMLKRVDRRLRTLMNTCDRQLRQQEFPQMESWAAQERAIDLSSLSGEQLVARWQERERSVMDDFGGKSLLPGMIGGLALADLQAFLAEHFWDEDPAETARELSAGGALTSTVAADQELYEVGTSQRTVQAWIAAHGHRAAGEFDLAAPRWRERPEEVAARARQLAGGGGESPLARHERQARKIEERARSLRSRLSQRDAATFDDLLDRARRYLAFREDAKDVLMRGYETLRDLAREAGRRTGFGDDIFLLTREEMLAGLARPLPSADASLRQGIDTRRRRRRAQTALRLAQVIDAAAVDHLGESSVDAAAQRWEGFGVSGGGGQAEGPVRVVRRIEDADARNLGDGYVLVCPSTDPSWTPLFARAAGLVLECGGVLSHGAVVAREMGLPAVVIPGATDMLKDGERVRVDGRRGWVARAGTDLPDPSTKAETSQSLALPPPPGPIERRAWRIRNAIGLLWAIYLATLFLLPARFVYAPTMRALDALLWPLVREVGRPWTVALLAGAVALFALTVQRLLTDNRRLLVAKRRAAALRKSATALPRGSAQRRALDAPAAGVQWRLLMAAMVPVGLLLGPMIVPFLWMKARVAEEPWSPGAAGGSVQVVARIDGEYTGPLRLQLGDDARQAGVAIDSSTPADRAMPALRKTLESLLAMYQTPDAAAAEKWQLALGPDEPTPAAAADLRNYLDHGIPAQAVTWVVRVPAHYAGKFPITVAEGSQHAQAQISAGDAYPPAAGDGTVTGAGPLRALTVIYPRANVEHSFWRPLAFLRGKLGAWDIGWVGVYVLAYVLVLLAGRWVLRVA